jgi:serine/threonine-protein kinase HipA
MINTASVSMWGQKVGVVVWQAELKYALFEYYPSFIKLGLDVSPFKMPISSPRVFSFPGLVGSSFNGLPGLLSDSLPDKFGNTLINRWLSSQGRPADSLNPVEMLCFIGSRSMGALEFKPAIPLLKDKNSTIEMDAMVALVNQVLQNRGKFKTSMKKGKDGLLDIIRIGTSAGGARAKAIIAYNPSTGKVRSGAIAAPKGFKHYLLKFDGVEDKQIGVSKGYGRIEMAYHLMAKEAGIDMMPCQLLEENGRAHFMTERFDRKGSSKIHVQTFSALQHYDYNNVTDFSYESLFLTLQNLTPRSEGVQLFRRMIFNVIARNCDDHAKNFSFLMDRSGKWKLSPAYDVSYSYKPGSKWVSRQSLSVNGKKETITDNDFLEVADQFKIKGAKTIVASIKSAVSRWPEFAKITNVKPLMRKEVEQNLVL